ncbi:curli production assembly/transport protein CsgE [Belliella sp. DSM 111904]|uniref:Curli production assembly/transport component CsgE n=1 Tax=Belliella filtrata TaxID=2923435 RepID=A0ABS9V1V5_9BACT|nr:curli production assembly/transport protein CsgE [Belliella filtrata]MCH7410361.1 curli production assembly/transport protein CsgE [Belliella filtrata]
MKAFIIILMFIIPIAKLQAQVEEIVNIETSKIDSLSKSNVIDTTKVLQEAPDELKNLFESIVKEETQKLKSGLNLELDGLIIDETKTKSGKEFYDFFFREWEAPEGAKNYTIFIEEKPFRLNTTMVEILINETLIFQSLLQPRGDVIESLAIDATATTKMYLANYEELLKQLGGSDMKGTGIY